MLANYQNRTEQNFITLKAIIREHLRNSDFHKYYLKTLRSLGRKRNDNTSYKSVFKSGKSFTSEMMPNYPRQGLVV